MLTMLSCSSFAVSSTCTLIGTSCRFSTRFCAVTMISSRPPVLAGAAGAGACCAKAAGIATSRADATGTPLRTIVRGLRVSSRINLRRLLRVIDRSPLCGFCASRRPCKATPSACEISNCRRHGRVLAEDRPKGLLQRSQPGLVISPMLKRFVEDGLAYLLGARRADSPLVLVEPEALLLIRQIAISEQAAHLGLRLRHDGLVDDAVDPVRQRAIEVRHQVDVVAVVPAEIREVVREALTACKVLLEAGEATGERMPAGIDELGVREHLQDQTHVLAVVGILVDEERRTALALHARGFDVAGAERVQLSALELGKDLGKGLAGLAPSCVELVRGARHIGQLHGSFDQRVTGEDLLQQRGSGTGKADDEYGVRRRAARACARGEKLGGEQRLRAADEIRVLLRTVGMGFATQCIAPRVVRKRLFVGGLVLSHLAEGEFEVQPVLVPQIPVPE